VPVQVVPYGTTSLSDLRALATPFLAPLGLIGIVIIFTIFMLVKREDLCPEAAEVMRQGIAEAEAEPDPDPELVFDHAYVDPPPNLKDGWLG